MGETANDLTRGRTMKDRQTVMFQSYMCCFAKTRVSVLSGADSQNETLLKAKDDSK